MVGHVNSNFVFLEDFIKGTIAANEQTQENLNILEQYTHKNSVHFFGIKEANQESPEQEAIKVFKESLRIKIQNKIKITHWAGKFRQSKEDKTIPNKVPNP